MTIHRTRDQITAAIQRAAWAARERTHFPDRIAKFPRAVDDVEESEDCWWHIDRVGVIGEPDE
ncbi:MAG: hypothetical protein ACJ789_12260 [Thermomicrobiales bacterium]